jgi:hypothetical protein
LLVAGEEGWIDLAHEALMEDWQRFAQWRQENRQLRRLIDRVEDALREWQEEPKDENLLPRGLLAQTRQRWQELEPDLDTAARSFTGRLMPMNNREALSCNRKPKQLSGKKQLEFWICFLLSL